jgi:hypothetical protein
MLLSQESEQLNEMLQFPGGMLTLCKMQVLNILCNVAILQFHKQALEYIMQSVNLQLP